MKKNYSYLLFALVVMFAIACNPAVVLELQRPAEVNLTSFKKVAISDFKNPTGNGNYSNPNNQAFGSAGTELADALTSRVMESQKYEVLDRQNLESVLAEQKLSASGLVDEKSTMELGGILGAAALITGGVSSAQYSENPVTSVTITNKAKDGTVTKDIIYTRSGSIVYNANIKVTDLKTSRILVTKPFNITLKDQELATNSTPQNIDVNTLYTKAQAEVLGKFMRMIAPYTEAKRVSFQKHGEMPELSAYIDMLKAGNTEQGVEGLKALANKTYTLPIIQAKALYNYARILTFVGDPFEAEKLFIQALKLDPTNGSISSALVEAKAEINYKNKMKEQGM